MGASFRIVILADSSRHAVAVNTQLLGTLLSRIKGLSPQPKFIFFAGDMVYGGANVNEQLENWKKLFEDYYPVTMLYTVLGSHENNEAAFSNAFSHLPNEQLQGYQRTVYCFDYGSARFIVLNSNRRGSSCGYAIDAKQREWLKNILDNRDRKSVV